MADVEAYTDFANASAVIDPYAANINMSIFEDKVVDGKTVRVIKKSTPVNVLKGQIVQKIPTFKVEQAITKDIDSLGDDIDFIYQAATTSKAGTITELIGYGAFQGEYKKKDSKGNPFADSVKKVDDAIEQTINKYFANPYNISSVLTENTGKYSAESYVWDKDEASKDKSKLLKKIDPLTGLTTLDTDAPHYDEQVAEAREWVKKRMLSQLDSKRQLKTTSQIQLQEPREPSEAKLNRAEKEKMQLNAASAWNQLYTGGTPADKQSAAETLVGLPSAKEMGLLKVDLASKPGTVILKYENSKLNREIPMKGRTFEDFAASGVELHGITDKKKASQAGTGSKVYSDIDFTGVTAGRAGAEPVPIVIPVDVFKAKSDKSADAIQKYLPNGYIAEDTGTWMLGTNTVKITAPDGREISYKSDAKSPKDIITQKAAIENFLKPKTGTAKTGELD
jgi:hypothetical protein